MYWGKKILEWSEARKEAYETTLYLSNNYFVDGRDPNSYANVTWAFSQQIEVGRNGPSPARCATRTPADSNARTSPKSTSRKWSA